MTKAHLAAIAAFSLWGLLPIFWKTLSELSSFDLFAHRIFWSFSTLTAILIFKKNLFLLKNIWNDKKKRYFLTLSSLMISTNWLLYIYAINTGKILEASLGYFLNPIFNILIGSLFLKEVIRPFQWPSVILALLSLVYIVMTSDLNHIPWIAITLSLTFALYSLIRKTIHVGSLEGLTFETSLMVLPVGIWWFTHEANPLLFLDILPSWKILLLMTAGLITSIPLILFAYGAKRLNLGTLGFIQYLSPSLKFVCGLFIFHEPLSQERLISFVIIWIALAFYTIESFIHLKNFKKVKT